MNSSDAALPPLAAQQASALASPRPLSEPQSGLWFAQQLAPDDAGFNTAHVAWIDGPLDVEVFRAAADQAACEAQALALRFLIDDDGEALQWHDPAHVPLLSMVDLAGSPDPESAVREAMAADRRVAVDPCRDRIAVQRLYRLGPARFAWYLRVHHLAADGYGMALLGERVRALMAGDASPALAPLAPVLDDDAAYRGSERRRIDGDWWRVRMQDAPAAVALGHASHGNEAALPGGPDARRQVVPVPAPLREALLTASLALDLAWPDLLTALAAHYVRRMAAVDEAVVGVPWMGRLGNPSARVPAMVMNVLPLRVRAGSGSLGDELRETARALAEGRRHGRYRSEQLRRDLGRVGQGGQLHGPLLNVQPFYRPLQLPGVATRLEVLGTGPVDDLVLGFRGDAVQQLDLEIEAHPLRHDAEAVELHARRLLHLLEAALAPGALERAGVMLPLALPEERQRYLLDVNATDHPVPTQTLAALIEQSLLHDPDAPALVFEGNTLARGALEQRSRVLAAQLQAAGAGPGQRVAVALPRSLELVIALVAVLRSGAAYLPLDLDHPDARLARILEAAQPVCVLAGADQQARMSGHAVWPPGNWPPAPDAALPDLPLSLAPGPQDPAYVIYTSGSTGAPKGVVVDHRAIVNRLEWMRTAYRLGADERILQKTPATFDVSVWEFFLPLLCGGTLVLAAPGMHRDPRALAALVRRERITTLHFVPSMLDAFLAVPGVEGLQLRHVFVSGEALGAGTRDRFHARISARLHNLYGPTEAAVDVSAWEAGPDDRSDPVPIGRPVWNTRLYVLDAWLQPLPAGVPGELFIGGVQVAHGYLGQAALTAERFVADPFVPGARMYRTGDLATWRRDGAVQYLGRNDHQVKLRGLRIELGEIETLLRELDGIEQVAVLARDGRLAAFVSPPGMAPATLRSHLAAHLPDYMVPAAFVDVADWPVTANGKLDRDALPMPRWEATGQRAPETAAERKLAPLFAQALRSADSLGVDQDFFASGGDSLAAVHLLLAVEQAWQREVGLGTLFRHPTIAALAAWLERAHDAVDQGLGPVLQLTGGDATLTPLFAIHPAGGIAWNYRLLARALAPARSVYGLQSPALDPDEAVPESIEQLAGRYADQVARLQPTGVVHLLGWSVGGILAQAMAVALQRRGRQVGLLALLDAYPAECWRSEPEPDPIAALRALLAIAGHDPDAHPELDSRAAILAFLRRGGSALGSLPGAVLDGVVRAVTDTNRLIRGHHHRCYDGVLLHVRAARDHHHKPHLQSALWQAHARSVEALPLPFLHAEMTGRDAVAVLAPLLSARLQAWDAQEVARI